VSDADLVRFLDGEAEGAERDALAARIAADPAATERLATLRARTADLGSWLRDLGPWDGEIADAARVLRDRLRIGGTGVTTAARVEVARATDGQRARRGAGVRGLVHATPPLLRAAAIVLVFASAALAVPPARAWLVATAARVADALGLRAPPPAPAAASPEAGPDVTYHFPIAGDTLYLQVSGTPAGQVVLRRTASANAYAELSGGGGASVVLEADRRIRYVSAGSTAAVLTLGLPSHVSVASVRVGEAAAIAYRIPADGRAETVIRLVR
jgi:hypothetical protein